MISIQDMLKKQKAATKRPAAPAKPAPSASAASNQRTMMDMIAAQKAAVANRKGPVSMPTMNKQKGGLTIADMVAKQRAVNRTGRSTTNVVKASQVLTRDEEALIRAEFSRFIADLDKIAAQQKASAVTVKPSAAITKDDDVKITGFVTSPITPEVEEQAVAAFVEGANDLIGGISLGSEETGAEQTMVVKKPAKKTKRKQVVNTGSDV